MKLNDLDFSRDMALAGKIHEQIEEDNSMAMAMLESETRMKEQQRHAVIETAEMKGDLKTVIHNQNDYISMLKEQNEYIKQVLNNMFVSSEDSVIVQKEILKIIQESNSSDSLAADKGLDVVIQLVFNVLQVYLKSKGISF